MTVRCTVCGQRRVEKKVDSDKSLNNDGSLRTLVERYQCACGEQGTYYRLADGTETITGCVSTEVTA